MWIIDKGNRELKSRLEQVHVANVGLVNVLKANNYTLEDGEPSVYEKEAKKWQNSLVDTSKEKSKRTFENQDYCQNCWDYGSLICCNHCPASYHPICDGLNGIPGYNWTCPHHRGCVTCKRSNKATGFLFRCEVCPHAYCEDCLPDDYEFTGINCDRWEKLGYKPRSSYNACFIYCSKECKKFDLKHK